MAIAVKPVPISAIEAGSGASSFNAIANRSAGGGSASGTVTVLSSAPLSVGVAVSASGGTFTMTATVNQGTTPMNGASVKFSITDPGGGVTVLSATTNASGVASVKMKMNGRRDLRGTYSVVATATTATATGSGSGGFVY